MTYILPSHAFTPYAGHPKARRAGTGSARARSAIVVFTLMTTWRTGRQLVAARIHRGEILLTDLMDAVSPTPIPRVPGVAIFLFSTPRVAPPALIANLRYNKVLHDRNARRSSTSAAASSRSSSRMASWKNRTRNTTRAARFFNLPSNRTVEVGIQVDL